MNRDKAFLIFAIIAVTISLIYLIVSLNKVVDYKSLTGQVTGSANLSVETSTRLNFSVYELNWGSGQVNAGQTSATLNSVGGIVLNGNWTNVTNGLILENLGNVNVSLSLQSASDAATFLGGTSPSYQWNITNNESGSCNQSEIPLAVFNDVNSSGSAIACSNFGYINGADEIRIDIKLVVPYNSRTGALSDVITATGTAV